MTDIKKYITLIEHYTQQQDSETLVESKIVDKIKSLLKPNKGEKYATMNRVFWMLSSYVEENAKNDYVVQFTDDEDLSNFAKYIMDNDGFKQLPEMQNAKFKAAFYSKFIANEANIVKRLNGAYFTHPPFVGGVVFLVDNDNWLHIVIKAVEVYETDEPYDGEFYVLSGKNG